MGTRKEAIRRDLPHAAAGSEARAREGVVIPLVHYIRRHREAADAFILRNFARHRITAIGEYHENPGSNAGFENPPNARNENICVRLFMRDIVIQLYRERARNGLRFLVIESDEEEITRELGYHWRDRPLSDRSTYPAGTRNRSAYWHAQSLPRGRARRDIPNLAFMEALLQISRECDDGGLEVVGVDTFARRQDLEGWGPDGGMQPAHEAREARIAENIRTRVLSRMGERERALIYYGMGHLTEENVEPPGTPRLTPGGTYLQRLAASGQLRPGDVYTVATFYEGSATLVDEMSAPGGGDDTVDVVLARIYDMLRAEFDDHNLGFDIDDAQSDSIVFETGLRHSLGEAYDGYLFFRDLNSWDGRANLPEADRSRRYAVQPPLRITQVVPSTAPAGNPVFLYGHVFTSNTQVRFGPHLLTPTRIVNENVCEIRVPPGTAGAVVDVAVERMPIGPVSTARDDTDRLLDELITPPDRPRTRTLRGAFRYP